MPGSYFTMQLKLSTKVIIPPLNFFFRLGGRGFRAVLNVLVCKNESKRFQNLDFQMFSDVPGHCL